MRVAINGFGRIGALLSRAYLEYWRDKFDLVAINASGASGNMSSQEVAHRLRYDSNYGVSKEGFHAFQDTIRFSADLALEEKTIKILGEPDAERLPWKELGVEIVVDCTGEYLTPEKAAKHLKAGAKKVILSAPPKDDSIPIFVYGVNHKNIQPEMQIVSNASCTTNALAPLVSILRNRREIINLQFTTIHAFTGDQRLTDGKHSDPRRARRASGNIIPTKTGAANNIERIFPELCGRVHGLAFRVDTPTVSALYAVCALAGAPIQKEMLINDIRGAAATATFGDIIGWTDEDLVSSDFLKDTRSVIVDMPLLKVQPVHGRDINIVTITGWYDNEWAYACRLGDLLSYIITQQAR